MVVGFWPATFSRLGRSFRSFFDKNSSVEMAGKTNYLCPFYRDGDADASDVFMTQQLEIFKHENANKVVSEIVELLEPFNWKIQSNNDRIKRVIKPL